MNLTLEERQVLVQAAAEGGTFSIRGLSPEHMKLMAEVADSLQELGLARIEVRRSGLPGSDGVDLVVFELTDRGRRYLARKDPD